MTIEIEEPKLQERIQRLMDSGAYRNVEDLLQRALEATPQPETPRKRQSLSDFLLNSPLRGADLHVERNKDEARVPEL